MQEISFLIASSEVEKTLLKVLTTAAINENVKKRELGVAPNSLFKRMYILTIS